MGTRMKVLFSIAALSTVATAQWVHPIMTWLNAQSDSGFRSVGYEGPPMTQEESDVRNLDDDLRSWDPVMKDCRKHTLKKNCRDVTDGPQGPCMWAKTNDPSHPIKCSAFDCFKIQNVKKCTQSKPYYYGDFCKWEQGRCYPASIEYDNKCKRIRGRNQCRNTEGCDFGLFFEGDRNTGDTRCLKKETVSCRNQATPTMCARFERDTCHWLKQRGTGGSIVNGKIVTDRFDSKCISKADLEPKCSQLRKARCNDPEHNGGLDCIWLQGKGCFDVNKTANCKSPKLLDNINECKAATHCVWERYSYTEYRCANKDGWVQNCRGLDRQPKACKSHSHCVFWRDTRECRKVPK